MSLYSTLFVDTYKFSRSQLPLDLWAEVIGSKLPEFKENPSLMYNPISLSIKIAGGINNSEGIVALRVSPIDTNWYSKICSAVETMTGKKNLNLVDYLGDPIKNLTITQLDTVGELDIVDRVGNVIRLESVPAPPEHMATNKLDTIDEWFTDNQDMIAEVIADELMGKTEAEIAQCTRKGRSVQLAIEGALRNSKKDWNGFLKTYSMDDHSKNISTDTKTSQIAKSILNQFRIGLKANEKQIRAFQALNAKSYDDEDDDEQLWSHHAASIASDVNYKDERSMYMDISEDAMYSPMLSAKVGFIIHRGLREKSKRSIGKKIRVPVKISNDVHPMNQFYDDHFYAKFKKYPGHVIDKFNKKEHVGAQYPGSVQKAKAAFKLFSGRFNEPSIESNMELPQLVPIESNMELPKLVPIASHVLVPISKLESPHSLVRIGNMFGDAEIEEEIQNEELDVDVFGLPNLSSFLPKRK